MIIFDRTDFLGERFELETVSITEKGIEMTIALIVPGNIVQLGNEKLTMFLVNEMRNIDRNVAATYTGIDIKKGTATMKLEILIKGFALKMEKSKLKITEKEETENKAEDKVKEKLVKRQREPRKGMICKIEGCHGTVKAKGLCSRHYQQDWAKRYKERE